MRRYNQNPLHAKKVQFYGFDMQFSSVAYQSTRTTYAASTRKAPLGWRAGSRPLTKPIRAMDRRSPSDRRNSFRTE